MQLQQTKAAPSLLFGTVLIREVEMEVVFGTPSKNCSGAGVCLIAGRFPEGYKIACPHAPAHIHFLPGNEIVFRFRKKNLDDHIVRSYFNRKYFTVEESFQLPKPLVERWNLSTGCIPAGRYPLEEYSREWRLYFSL